MAVDLSEEQLRRDYYQLGLTQEEIADKHNCSRMTVVRRMGKYDLPTLPSLRVEKKRSGRTYYCSGSKKFAEYQLVAIADGADPNEVFGRCQVHHINGCAHDNRPENLLPLTPHEHGFVEHNDFEIDAERGVMYKELEIYS